MYDEAKRFAEAITIAYHREHGLDVRIARIFNCFGPRMKLDDGRAVPNFVVQALQGKPLTVYGDGSQTRSLCYVDDLVEGLSRLLKLKLGGRVSESDLIMNLGNPEETTIDQLAKMIVELTGSQSELVLLPLPTNDPKLRCPDITRAVDRLGWTPQVDLKEGLSRTITSFRALLPV